MQIRRRHQLVKYPGGFEWTHPIMSYAVRAAIALAIVRLIRAETKTQTIVSYVWARSRNRRSNSPAEGWEDVGSVLEVRRRS